MSLARRYGYATIIAAVAIAAGVVILSMARVAFAETGSCTTTTSPGYWAAWTGPNCNIVDPYTGRYTCGAVTGAMWVPPTSTTWCTNSYCGLPSRTYATPITTCFYTQSCFIWGCSWMSWGMYSQCVPTYNCFQVPQCSTRTYDTTEWYNCTGSTCEKCTSTPYAYCSYDLYFTYFCESQPRYRVSCSPTSATPTTCSPVSLTCPDGYVAKCAPSCTGSGCGTCTPSCTGHTCAANRGQTCYSATNACGYKTAAQVQCDGSCPALTPTNPPNYGNTCTSCNNTGKCATGTITCSGSCSAVAPPNEYTDYCAGYKLVDYGGDCRRQLTSIASLVERYVGGECSVAPFNVVGGCQNFSPGTKSYISKDLVVPTPMTATGDIYIQLGGLLRIKTGGSLKLCAGCKVITGDSAATGISMEGGELITE